jgi:hypothetical protein
MSAKEHDRSFFPLGVDDILGITSGPLAGYGVACPTVTGAATGSFEFEAPGGVYTELQCGSYIFMDADYGRNLDRDGGPTTASSRASTSGRR